MQKLVQIKRPNKLARERDRQIAYMVGKIRTLAPHLDDWRFLPLLQSYARITLLVERSYQTIKSESLVSAEAGEIRRALDTIRKLALTQSQLAKELGLTPSTIRAISKEKRVDLPALLADKEDDDETTLAN